MDEDEKSRPSRESARPKSICPQRARLARSAGDADDRGVDVAFGRKRRDASTISVWDEQHHRGGQDDAAASLLDAPAHPE